MCWKARELEQAIPGIPGLRGPRALPLLLDLDLQHEWTADPCYKTVTTEQDNNASLIGDCEPRKTRTVHIIFFIFFFYFLLKSFDFGIIPFLRLAHNLHLSVHIRNSTTPVTACTVSFQWINRSHTISAKWKNILMFSVCFYS